MVKSLGQVMVALEQAGHQTILRQPDLSAEEIVQQTFHHQEVGIENVLDDVISAGDFVTAIHARQQGRRRLSWPQR